ncbi:uncharacterized protein RHOBADRAFT_66702 [Rhodotorula graminis WP1]|uniref:Uncharacterized protein n=1 Tax=Rhodotorula graminis (strain WP1) TaxID=578459 RepID=A0A0P9EX81_RHOGW|nr:uncharacterized protein RHOBADRAFT_66702 [Rhodotorula graminis WP1]KPV74057.1 hypothetical protein RHOBADRAFT_66702 [Rhodotorula graminis WP1]
MEPRAERGDAAARRRRRRRGGLRGGTNVDPPTLTERRQHTRRVEPRRARRPSPTTSPRPSPSSSSSSAPVLASPSSPLLYLDGHRHTNNSFFRLRLCLPSCLSPFPSSTPGRQPLERAHLSLLTPSFLLPPRLSYLFVPLSRSLCPLR